jgi:hypothetical protein
MQRVSLRTLLLMLELLMAVSVLQYLTAIRAPRAGAVWLAGNDPPPTTFASQGIGRPVGP